MNLFKLIKAAAILGGVGIVIKEILEVDKSKKKAKEATKKQKPKSFFDEMKDAVMDEVDKVKTEVVKMKDELEKTMTPPNKTKTKSTPKQKTDTASKASSNGNGKATVKDIKDFKEIKKTAKKTRAKAKPKAKASTKTKTATKKKTTVKVEEEAVIRYKVKDTERTVKGKVTKKINEVIKGAKSFVIGKTGNIKDVDMSGYKKLNLVCVSSKAANINKLATYYNTKYAKVAKNKTASVKGKLTSKNGEYYLYILVK